MKDIAAIREDAHKKALELLETFNEVKQSPMYRAYDLRLNMDFLVLACESCFIDIARHQDFHEISVPDNHKRAAFIFKWLSRTRPIWASGPGEGKGGAIRLHINSYFALLGALGELDVNMKVFAPSNIAQHIIYSGTYRDISAETWALIFCTLERLFPANAQAIQTI